MNDEDLHELLAEVVSGERAADDPALRAVRAEHPDFDQRVRELAAVVGQVRGSYADEQAVLAAARALDRAPGEERIADTLAAEERGPSAGVEVESSVRWLMVAAALVLVSLLAMRGLQRGDRPGPGPDGRVWMGSESVDIVSPSDQPWDGEVVEWQSVMKPGTRYELTISSKAGGAPILSVTTAGLRVELSADQRAEVRAHERVWLRLLPLAEVFPKPEPLAGWVEVAR